MTDRNNTCLQKARPLFFDERLSAFGYAIMSLFSFENKRAFLQKNDGYCYKKYYFVSFPEENLSRIERGRGQGFGMVSTGSSITHSHSSLYAAFIQILFSQQKRLCGFRCGE